MQLRRFIIGFFNVRYFRFLGCHGKSRTQNESEISRKLETFVDLKTRNAILLFEGLVSRIIVFGFHYLFNGNNNKSHFHGDGVLVGLFFLRCCNDFGNVFAVAVDPQEPPFVELFL